MAATFGSARLDDDIVNAPAPAMGEFSKGLRSGLYGAGSQLQSFAGGIGAAAGADEFAANRMRDANALQATAQSFAPRVTSYKQGFSSLRDFGDYAAGLAGQAVPSVALGVGAGALTAATGGGALAALGAGALSQAPLEIGDVLQRQQLDPNARARSAGENLRDAVLTGGASAVGQAIVPAALGGRLVGKGVQGALRAGEKELVKEAGTGVTRSMLRDAAIEGASEGGGELVKQQGVGFGVTPDLGAAAEAAVGGALVGGGLGAAGAGAEKFHANKGAMKDAAARGAEAAQGAVTDFAGRIKQAAAPKSADEDVVRNEGLSPEELAEAGNPATPRERALELLNAGTTKAGDAAKRVGEFLKGRTLSDEDRARVDRIVSGAGDAADNAWAATRATAERGADTFMRGVDSVTEALGNVRRKFGETEPKTDAKKSEDFSGVRQQIVQEIAPHLPEGIVNNPQSLAKVGEMVRNYIDSVKSGDLDTMQSAAERMHALFGEETEGMLARVYDRVATSSPEESERFAKNMQRSQELGVRNRNLRSVVEQNLPDNLKANAGEMTDGLLAWARGEGRSANNGRMAPLMHAEVRRQVEQVFGKNTPKVMKALESHINEVDPKTIADVAGAPETGTDMDFYGTGKNRQALQVFPSPEAHKARFPDSKESAADRLMKQLSEKYPDREVKFVPAREAAKQLGWSEERLMAATNGNPDEAGFVATSRMENPDELSDTQLAKMRLDTSAHAGSKSRVNVDGQAYDAVRITKHFLKTDQGSDRGDVRLARAFMDGIAALQAKAEGAIEVPDSTVIGTQNGKPMTFGEAKKLDVRTPSDKKADKASADFAADLNALRDEYRATKDPDERDAVRARAQALIDEAEDVKAASQLREGGDTDVDDILEGRYEVDPSTGNIHELEATGGVKPITHNADATPRVEQRGATETGAGRQARNNVNQLADRIARANSPAAEKVASRLRTLVGAIESMSDGDRGQLLRLTAESKLSAVADVVNALARKYADRIVAPKVQSDGAALSPQARERQSAKAAEDAEPVQPKQPQQPTVAELEAQLDRTLAEYEDAVGERKRTLKVEVSRLEAELEQADKREGPPGPKAVAAKKAALDQAASSSDPALLSELRTTDNAEGLRRTAEYLAQEHPDSKAAEVAGERFDQLVQDEDTAYSLQRANPGAAGPVNRQDVAAYIQRVLGNSVALAWDKLPHAGEFERDMTGDVIRLSVYALNPKSVAFHESLHAFFAQLRDAGAQRISQVLEKAAAQPRVMRWMETHFANEPAVVQQIRTNAEERAAYMYQLWASEPAFRAVLNPQATTVFGKVAQFIRDVLGIWSNDQRALHIMEHFHSGEYAKNIGKPDTAALLGSGTNRAVEQFRSLAQPLAKLGDALFGAGSARLRDTNIAALTEIADTIKPSISGSENKATGFIPAARGEFTARLNAWGERLLGSDKQQVADALEHLQRGTNSQDAGVQRVVDATRKALQEAGAYMRAAGVDFGNLGPDYFPRVWSADYISRNQQAFLAMLDPYVKSGVLKGDPKEIMRRLIANDGNNFDVDTRQPGMQHAKERELTMLTPDDVAPFLSKDLYQTMSSYISQASRRAEWARRFGGDGKGLDSLLKEAKRQGASDEQIQMTEKYLKGVTGTLGDSINPEARRLMGNAIIYQNIRLLPLAIFSSVVDPLGIVVRGGTVGDAWSAFRRGVREVPLNFKRYDAGSRDASTLLAESLGVIENASLMHSLGALYSQGMVGSTGRKINDAFFRFNLMEQYNRSMRVAATETAMKFIERNAAKNDAEAKRFLAELNLTPADVKHVGGQLDVSSDKMRDAINKWVDGAILRPDAADKPIWFNDPHWALVSHLKQFTYAFHHTILDRVVKEAREGNYKPAAALAGYVPIMIAADYMKGFIQGGGEQPAWKKDWGPAEYAWSGVQRAGLFGVGQIGVDVANDIQRGGGGFGALVGPTIEQFTDAAQVVGGTERFNKFALDAMPANALYRNLNVGE